jgi:branched-chain amino acid transport system substrate-binding protein
MTNLFFPAPAFLRSVSRSRSRWLLLAAFAALAAMLWPSLAAAQDSINIGVVLPSTGAEAKPGKYQKEGIDLAVKQINDGGGITVGGKKYQIKTVYYDDGSDQKKSASMAETAMNTDAIAVIGGYATALGEAESVMADRYKTPWISPGAGASSIYNHGYKFTFGTLSPISNLGSTSMDFLGDLVNKGKLKKGLKIAMAVENTDHGVDYANGVKDWISKHPGMFQLVFDDKFEWKGTDFSPILQRVRSANADIFLSDAHLQDYILMQRQYLQSGMKHQMISYGARGPEADARKALGDGVNYIFSAVWWSPDLPYPQVKKFNADYKAFTGHDPDSWYAGPAYESVRMLKLAIENAKSLDKGKIRDALAKAVLKDSLLPGGELRYGPNGQAFYPFLIMQNKPGGKVDIVFPKSSATGDAVAPIPR